MKKDRIALQDELREIAPRLADLQARGDGHTVPPDYFEQLENRVFQRIDALGERRLPTEPVRKSASARVVNLRWITAVAASLSLALGAWWFMRPQPGPAVPENYAELAAKLTAEDAEIYVRKNLQEFETATLATYAIVEAPAAPQAAPAPPRTPDLLHDLNPDELDLLLNDLSDEELEAILL